MSAQTIRPSDVLVGDLLSNWTSQTAGTVQRVEVFTNGCVAIEWVDGLGQHKVCLHGPGSSVTVLRPPRMIDGDALIAILDRHQIGLYDSGTRFGLRLAREGIDALLASAP